MGRKIAGFLLILGGMVAGADAARGDVIITLEAFAGGGQPITGPVAPGTNAVVDILLSADAEDDPVADVRLIQFDFDATGAGIQLVSFTWTVDAMGYSFQDPDLPITNVTSIFLGSAPGLLTLTAEPVKVASVDITINAAATLDAANPENSDGNFGASVMAGFNPSTTYTFMAGNLQGGSLQFTVTGGGDGGNGGGEPDDTDGDGVADPDDAFPDDPDETTDTDDNGVGDNADPDDDGDGVDDDDDAFPTDPAETDDSNGNGIGDNGEGVAPPPAARPRMCGAGMLGWSVFMLLGLGLISHRPRRGY